MLFDKLPTNIHVSILITAPFGKKNKRKQRILSDKKLITYV